MVNTNEMIPKNTQIVQAARTKLPLSPMLRPTMDMLRESHDCELTPGRMGQIRQDVIYFATAADLRKIAAL